VLLITTAVALAVFAISPGVVLEGIEQDHAAGGRSTVPSWISTRG
jgi:hypothetical protein